MKNTKFLLIPIELCKFALTKRKKKEVALWICLKTCTSGHFLKNKELIKSVCEQLEIKSIKTFNKYFSWLIDNEWITVNSKRKSYRIIGFNQLARRYHYKSTLYALFNVNDIKKILGFFSAVIITYCIKQIKASRNKGQSDFTSHELSENSDSFYKSKKYCPYSFVPITYLAKFLNVPKTTANRFKQEAVNAGFISAENKFYPTIYNLSDYDTYLFHKKVGGDYTKKFKKYAGTIIWEQMPDRLVSNIIFKKKRKVKRKKMEPLISHIY